MMNTIEPKDKVYYSEMFDALFIENYIAPYGYRIIDVYPDNGATFYIKETVDELKKQMKMTYIGEL